MNSGTVSVTSTPTLVYSSDLRPGIVVQNTGDAAVFIGTSTVAASGANAGLSLAAGATLAIPFISELFAVVATGTGTVAFMAAG